MTCAVWERVETSTGSSQVEDKPWKCRVCDRYMQRSSCKAHERMSGYHEQSVKSAKKRAQHLTADSKGKIYYPFPFAPLTPGKYGVPKSDPETSTSNGIGSPLLQSRSVDDEGTSSGMALARLRAKTKKGSDKGEDVFVTSKILAPLESETYHAWFARMKNDIITRSDRGEPSNLLKGPSS